MITFFLSCLVNNFLHTTPEDSKHPFFTPIQKEGDSVGSLTDHFGEVESHAAQTLRPSGRNPFIDPRIISAGESATLPIPTHINSTRSIVTDILSSLPTSSRSKKPDFQEYLEKTFETPVHLLSEEEIIKATNILNNMRAELKNPAASNAEKRLRRTLLREYEPQGEMLGKMNAFYVSNTALKNLHQEIVDIEQQVVQIPTHPELIKKLRGDIFSDIVQKFQELRTKIKETDALIQSTDYFDRTKKLLIRCEKLIRTIENHPVVFGHSFSVEDFSHFVEEHILSYVLFGRMNIGHDFSADIDTILQYNKLLVPIHRFYSDVLSKAFSLNLKPREIFSEAFISGIAQEPIENTFLTISQLGKFSTELEELAVYIQSHINKINLSSDKTSKSLKRAHTAILFTQKSIQILIEIYRDAIM